MRRSSPHYSASKRACHLLLLLSALQATLRPRVAPDMWDCAQSLDRGGDERQVLTTVLGVALTEHLAAAGKLGILTRWWCHCMYWSKLAMLVVPEVLPPQTTCTPAPLTISAMAAWPLSSSSVEASCVDRVAQARQSGCCYSLKRNAACLPGSTA